MKLDHMGQHSGIDFVWVGLAVTIMAGLTFGSVITMILVPVLYAIFFNVNAGSSLPAGMAGEEAGD